MTQRLLITYASGSGSTGEVADAISDVIKEMGASVDVRPVTDVEHINRYSAVVLGSSIRAGRWLPEAIAFLDDFQDTLAARPLAFFTTCLTMVDDTARNRQTVLTYIAPILDRAPLIKPVGIGLFAGSLDPTFRLVLPTDMGPYVDYRNWEAIRTWATAVGPALLAGGVASHLAVTDLSNEVLAYTDLSHSDLSQVDLHGTDLYHADLSDTSLVDANLDEADLAHSDLRGSDLEHATLHWADLSNGNLRDANLSQANLLGADLQEADLTGANLSRSTLNGANLKNSTMQQVNLCYADLNWTDLSGALLDGADLRFANLCWTNLRESTLDRTNLQGARYNDYTQWPEGFSPADAGCVYIGSQQ